MSDPEILTIIQARMGSTRLPGKMMRAIVDGKGPLEILLDRVRQSQRAGHVVVATSLSPDDQRIEELCMQLDVPCFRGAEQDVLDRFYQAAYTYGPPDAVVRLTGDCPLLDPAVVDRVIEVFTREGADYASNVDPPTWPDGLDTEVFTFDALERAWESASKPSDREHVTTYIRGNPGLFATCNVSNDVDLSHWRWTLDEAEDLQFLQGVFMALSAKRTMFGINDVLDLLEQRPELAEINQHIGRNEGYMRSIKEDI